MNEEEKKVVEHLKKTSKDRIIIPLDDEILIALSLIEKLQKENEELKNKIMKKELEIIGKEEYTKASMGEIIEQYYTANEDCVSKQKIKDKIEELEKKHVYQGNGYYCSGAILVLQELLEESEGK